MKRTIAIFAIVAVMLSSVAIYAVDNRAYVVANAQYTLVGQTNSDEDLYLSGTVGRAFAFTLTANNKTIYFASEETGVDVEIYKYHNNMYVLSYTKTTNTYDSTSNLYYIGFTVSGWNWNYYNVLPRYDSYLQGLGDIRTYIDNESVQQSQELTYSLPAGNALIVQVPLSNTDIEISTVSSEPYPPNMTGLNDVVFLTTDTFPTSIGYPYTSASQVPFVGYGPTTVFGRYMTFKYAATINTDNHAHKYLIVINPTYAYDSNGQRANPRVEVKVSHAISGNVYPLYTKITSGGWTTESEEGQVPYDIVYNDDTGMWETLDEEGNSVELTVGGSNIVTQFENTITGWLENIANEISSFFNGAVGAITVLANAVSNFAGTLKALYIWLPSPVLSILTSAIMLGIVIGVIKVFI